MRHRAVAVQYAHRGASPGNNANQQFHLRQAISNGRTLMAHLAAAERQAPGSTGAAFQHLTALMSELQRNSVPAFKANDEEE